MKLTGRQWGLVLVLVSAVALVTWGLERLLASSGGEWSAAIQALATVALVGITAVYVLLTHRMVGTQEAQLEVARRQVDSAQRMAFAEEVRRLSEFLTTEGHDAVKRLARVYPVPTDEDVPPETFGKLVTSDRVSDVVAYLRRVADHQPAPVRGSVYTALLAIGDAQTNLMLLNLSIEGALRNRKTSEGGEAGDRVSWDDVQVVFHVAFREGVGVSTDLEWADLVSGEGAAEAATAMEELVEAVAEYLWSLDSP